MKNFKINAITALVVGLNVATAHAARTTNPEPNQNVLYSGGSVFLNHADATNVDEPSHTAIGQSNLLTLLAMVMMHMVNKLKALETAIKFMQMNLLDMASRIKLVHNRLMLNRLKQHEKLIQIQIQLLYLV